MRHDLEDADWLYAIAIVGGALWLSESRGGRVLQPVVDQVPGQLPTM